MITTAGGLTHYVIPIGLYYTGSAMNLVLVNDYDAGSGIGSDGRFSNVRVVTGGSGNLSPIINDSGTQTTDQTDPVNLTVTAADPNLGDALSFSDGGSLPTGLTISSSGDISGTATTIGTYDVTITVDDGNGGSDNASFQWTVCDPVLGL